MQPRTHLIRTLSTEDAFDKERFYRGPFLLCMLLTRMTKDGYAKSAPTEDASTTVTMLLLRNFYFAEDAST